MAFTKLITRLRDQGPTDIHDQISRIAAGNVPSKESFPYSALKHAAEKFVSKNKALEPVSLEHLLLAIIGNHERPEVALAAFVPSLSTQSIQEILNERVEKWHQGEISLEKLVEVLMILNHWRPDIVPYVEVFHALGLMRLQSAIAADPTMGPRAVKDFLVSARMPNNLIVSPIVQWLADTQFDWLALTLDVHAENMDWEQAYTLSSWMSELKYGLPVQEDPNIISLATIITDKFPKWAYWARWNPDVKRIRDMSRWKEEDRDYFWEIAKLEGPCFTNLTKTSQRDALLDYIAQQPPMLGLGTTLLEFSSNDRQNAINILNLLTDVISHAAEENEELYNKKMHLIRQATHSRRLTERQIKALSECVLNSTTSDFISVINTAMFSKNIGSDLAVSKLQLILKLLNNPIYGNVAAEVDYSVCNALSEHLQERLEYVRVPTDPPTKWKDNDWTNLENLQQFGINLRWSRFADRTNNPDEAQMVRQWPEKLEFHLWREMLKFLHLNDDNLKATLIMQRYIRYRFVNLEPIDDYDREVAENMIRLWTSDSPRRQLLLIITDLSFQTPEISHTMRIEYFKAFPKLQDELVARLVSSFIDDCLGDWLSVYLLITSLATHDDQIIKLWQFAPFWHMELRKGQEILTWALQSLSLDPWFEFTENVAKVFPEMISRKSKQRESGLFRIDILTWSRKIKPYKSVLAMLQKKGDHFSHVTECFLKGSEDIDHSSNLEQILIVLSKNLSDSKMEILLEVLSFLDLNGRSALLIRHAVEALLIVTPHTLWVCQSILDSYRTLRIEVVESMIAYSLCRSDINKNDRVAIESIGELIAIETERDYEAQRILTDSTYMDTTDAYLREEMQFLVQEAIRLERLRRALSAQDKFATSNLIKELGIEDSSALRNAMESLPADMINCVELISETVFEFQIPIDKIKPLARKAIGAGTATSLIIRFSGYPTDNTLKFCIHFNTDVKPIGTKSHTQTFVHDKSADVVACYSRMTPLVFQLSRRLQAFLRSRYADGTPSIPVIYKFILTELDSIGSSCTVCGVKYQTGFDFGFQSSSSNQRKEIRRLLGTCPSSACKTAFSEYPIDIRLASLHEDPEAFDMLLQGIAANVHAGMYDSLPEPRPKVTAEVIKRILKSLPETGKLQGSQNLATHLGMTDTLCALTTGTTADFLTWVATSYAGFITHATDSLHLPSLPGSHQFLLAETSSSRELDFAKHVANMATGESTQILFHATAMARLPMILAQGLKCLSGTTLQAHGSSFGKGIYLSPEPGTAWPYASSQTSVQSWDNSQFKDGGYGVILGCEVAGKWAPVSSNKNIVVVTDPTCVVIRFIILIPKKNRVPIANHVVPAITSVCAGLRSGVL